MRNAITVMNAKGGVGKSTLTLTMAETLSVHHDKKVLVVDSDAHASISTMLISMSMMMLPPVLISLPFKILLFVLVDGWALVVGSLMQSFGQGVAATTSMAPGVMDSFAVHLPAASAFVGSIFG